MEGPDGESWANLGYRWNYKLADYRMKEKGKAGEKKKGEERKPITGRFLSTKLLLVLAP